MIKISPSGARLRLNGESGRKCGGTSASAVEKRCHWRFSQLSSIVSVVVVIIIVTTKSSTFEGCDRRSRNPFFQPTNFYNALLTYGWANAVITELCDIIKWISLLQGFLFGKICRFPLSVLGNARVLFLANKNKNINIDANIRRCLADCIVQSSKQSVHKLAAQSVPQSKA